MPKLAGAQILWECLVREGVDVVFGYPGGAILPAYDALLQYPIHHVLVRHEQGAARRGAPAVENALWLARFGRLSKQLRTETGTPRPV